MRWAPKRNRDGQIQQNCWITDSGYTVAECRLPEARYPITRPGGELPFAYAKDRSEVMEMIEQDLARTA
ncbi:hypothetical protein [Pseudomonas brassicacearum]|uniref:hypothetical protein n=1 Tax=Pseudomonas brassicacearum TaxID=930166 RepID=UPI00064057AE|nr:hypothetical protein [Pseudomonas brassicacearum]